MFERERDKIRALVRSLDYVMTIHGEEEMESDSLSILDVENAIFSGEIIERQREKTTSESKYLIAGKSLDDMDIIVVTKLSLTGKLVILTVYREDHEFEN